MQHTIQAFIFDLDGVIVDYSKYYIESLKLLRKVTLTKTTGSWK